MTSSFDSSNPNLQVITPSNAQNISFHGMSTGGSNNDLMVVWGGETINITDSNSLFYFDTKNQLMTAPISSNTLTGRIWHSMVTGVNDSVVYIFGGYDGSSGELLGGQISSQQHNFYNDLYKMNTNTNSINLVSVSMSGQPGTPLTRAQHSATILSNGKIYIIGGITSNSSIGQFGLVPISEIDIFDTLNNSWSKVIVTSTDLPQDRRLHGAVGTSNNQIIIFGGADLSLNKLSDVAVLDTFNDTLSWTKQKTNGNSPSARYSHTFTIVGNNAIVAYGSTYDGEASDPSKASKDNLTSQTNIFILDVTNYTWKTQYAPQNLPTNAGGIIGAIVLAVVAAVILVCFIRRKRKSTFMSTPYEKTPAAVPPIMGPAPENDDSPPTIPPLTSFQKDGSLGSDTRVLNSADQRSSFDSSHSNLSNNRLYNEQLNTGYQGGEYSPHSGIFSDELLPLPTQFGDNSSQQSLTIQTYPSENYQTSTYTPENHQTQSYTPENYQTQSYTPENYQTQVYPPENYLPTRIPLTINTSRTQEYSPRSEFYNTQGQSYQPPSHSSSQENLSYTYRPDDRSSPTQATPESDSNEGIGFKSPLFRTESLSPLAGMATTIPTDSRPLSLRSAARMSQPLSGTSTGIQPSRLRNENPESLGHSGNETRDDNDTPKGRLFVSNPDPGYESDQS
ncbi:14445_t:CDS:2 [Cetraspora pellucida]|uniref:14445_t:CDS:1 n=1 Tax=Cetraspora pellucida TaxID=1433469 RepID=A0A9N8WCW6_9GLOM|nr:14445_t:CDS:2 [Cetraspora pellucida]